MRVIALIQTRFNSTRLPGKALMDLNGMPVIQHIYRRLLGCRMVDQVALAVGVEKVVQGDHDCYATDERYRPLANLKACFSDEKDLLYRLRYGGWSYNADAILRITGDCWAHDPRLLDDMIRFFLDGYPHIQGVCNWNPRTYSEGVDAEIYTMELLNKLNNDKNCPREGFATYAVAHGMMTKYPPSEFPQPGVDDHLSIDTQEDLDIARKILRKIGNDEWRYEETVRVYHELTR